MAFIKYLICLLYFSLLIYLVFIGGNDYRYASIFSFRNSANILPFRQKFDFIQSGGYHNPKDLRYFLREVFGNLLLFLPFSLCLILGAGMTNIKKVILLAFATSLSIEIAQFILGIGTADVDDVILNILGAAVGAALSKWINQQRLRLHL